ncbi:retrotransposon protein, putative, ty1-copia subclass [Tanacetum coccineum]
MACKPFPHQVERAKDLLGLIHTDVCGPFRMVSREGASYFITFTDDSSRYGYVYLMKHKDEVFETFKVFQNEVENQLGYPKEMMRYYFYNPLENKVFVARNVEFFKNSLTLQEASGSHGLLEASGSDVGLELIQEDDTQPYENTRKRHDEAEPTEVEPHSVKVHICRSRMISQAPDRYGFYVDAKEHELGNLNEPPNYKAALSES